MKSRGRWRAVGPEGVAAVAVAVAVAWTVRAAEAGCDGNGDCVAGRMTAMVGVSSLRDVPAAVAPWHRATDG
jgi:hypothetical protein